MKLFIDTADIREIREANTMGLLDGVTTNPSLIAKTGRDFRSVVADIVKEVNGPISLEVTAMDSGGMVAEAKKLAEYSPNVVIKIPLTEEGLIAAKKLKEADIKTNVTLCFSPTQALLAAKAGATYISPFIGRLDDISYFGMELIEQVVQIYNNYGFDTQVIVASIRNPVHVRDAALIGAHVATIPFAVIKQLVRHPLTDIGIEKFAKDWEKVPKF
jgi:transaldolase